jgi:small-conductance mechanosensitive channel
MDIFKQLKPYLADIKQVLLIAGLVILALGINWLIRKALAGYAFHAKRLKAGSTLYKLLRTTSSFIIFAVTTVIILHLLPGLEKIGTTLLASAGILSVVIGLAAQQTFGNIISGLFIYIYKPFRVGEYVELNNGKNGIVEEINLRFTIIRNTENRRMVIPNTLISNEVIINSNQQGNRVCNLINIHVDYDTDIDKAIAEIQQIVAAHPEFYDSRTPVMVKAGNHPVTVRVLSLENFSVTLCAEAWCNADEDSYRMKCDLLLAIKKRFDALEIKMPSQTIKIIFGTTTLGTLRAMQDYLAHKNVENK